MTLTEEIDYLVNTHLDAREYALKSRDLLRRLKEKLKQNEISVQSLYDYHDIVERENAILREGMKGDYDLDAWLEWRQNDSNT